MGHRSAPDVRFLLSRKLMARDENMPLPHSHTIKNMNISPLRVFHIVSVKTCHRRCIGFFLQLLLRDGQQMSAPYIPAVSPCPYADTGRVLPVNEGERRSACSFLLGSGASCAEVRAGICWTPLAVAFCFCLLLG